MKLIQIFLLLISITFFSNCKEKEDTNELNPIVSVNDLDVALSIEKDKGFQILSIAEDETPVDHLKIDVSDEFAARGKVKIDIGKPYKLSVTLKNEGANPLILYSYWKGPVTSVRNFTMAGENGNPPTSETQKRHSDWITFEEVIEAQNGEDSFMLTILSQEGTFYLKEIRIESLK